MLFIIQFTCALFAGRDGRDCYPKWWQQTQCRQQLTSIQWLLETFVTDDNSLDVSWLVYFNTMQGSVTHTLLTAHFPGLPWWGATRKAKPNWILLKQETVSGSDISWAICKSAPRSRQITTSAPQHSVFHRPDALPATQPIVTKVLCSWFFFFTTYNPIW